jgi:hypothetical protein
VDGCRFGSLKEEEELFIYGTASRMVTWLPNSFDVSGGHHRCIRIEDLIWEKQLE